MTILQFQGLLPSKERSLAQTRTPIETESPSASSCLTVITGKLSGQVIKLNRANTVIGRNAEADLLLTSSTISRKHARIWRKEHNYFISDMGSTNGSFVNGQRINRKTPLFEGDNITLGDMTFRFSLYDRDDTNFENRRRNLAVTDELTGLFDKAYFNKVVDREFNSARHNTYTISLIFFSVDAFDQLLAREGVNAADNILAEIASLVDEHTRNSVIFARYGREDFVLLWRDTDLARSALLAEHIRSFVKRSTLEDGHYNLSLTLSAGISLYKGDTRYKDASEFVDAGETQLIRARKWGGNRLCYDNRL